MKLEQLKKGKIYLSRYATTLFVVTDDISQSEMQIKGNVPLLFLGKEEYFRKGWSGPKMAYLFLIDTKTVALTSGEVTQLINLKFFKQQKEKWQDK
jgi:hypothetical protein